MDIHSTLTYTDVIWFGKIPISGLSGSYGRYVFRFLSNLYTDLNNGLYYFTLLIVY